MRVRSVVPGLESCSGGGECGADAASPAEGLRCWCHDGEVEERPEREADPDLELTPEEIVAADEAMLLDLGGAEEVADLIARQSLGEPDTVADPHPVPAEG